VYATSRYLTDHVCHVVGYSLGRVCLLQRHQYNAIENEKPVQGRVDQYKYLVYVSRTTEGNLNGDVVKSSKQSERVVEKTLENDNFDHFEEMELLAKASSKVDKKDHGHQSLSTSICLEWPKAKLLNSGNQSQQQLLTSDEGFKN